MNQVWNIARKELSDGLRNRWLLAISLLFAVLAVGIAWLGAAASGQLGFTSIPATIASLASLATFLMPLIALLLAYDAIVGEDEGGTLMLLLTYPLGRGQILLGKFVGHGLILALARRRAPFWRSISRMCERSDGGTGRGGSCSSTERACSISESPATMLEKVEERSV